MQTPEQEYKRGLDLFGKKDYKGAFEAWKDAADRGYAKAMCDVGWMYSQGNSAVPKDNAKAFEYMLKAAEAGYVRAQNNIGLYYKNGTGTVVDIEKAVYWLELAEKAHYEKLAENTLKNCRQLLSQRGPRVSPEQEHALGMAAFSAKDYTKAFEHWLRAAEAGSPEGMCDVGWMYSQGYGIQKDNDKAFEWMLKSSNLGYVRAQNNLGLYYKNGTGTPVNLELAVHWLEKAERANYPKLAKKTLQEAKELLAKKTAEEKVAPLPDSNDAASSPQQAYALGLEMFGKKKFQQAFDYWLKAAEAGYTKAMCDIGWMYSQGHGVEKDNQKAFEYMLKAAQQGYVRAQNNIGLYYKNGTGCKPDLRQAVMWLEKAEKANYDKLAKKSLKEAKRMLEEEAKGSKPVAAPVADEEEQRSSGPEGNMDKYKSALKVALASKSVSEEQCKVLADLRHEHQITDRLHEQCLIELGYSLEEFRKMTVEAPKGPECVVCLDAVADHCILFCMHVCLCKDCARSFHDDQGKGKGTCPKCRTKVEMVKKIF